MSPGVLRAGEWMRAMAPVVKRRADAGEKLFQEVRDAYIAVTKSPDDQAAVERCLNLMRLCQPELDREPPGVFDYLAHVGERVR